MKILIFLVQISFLTLFGVGKKGDKINDERCFIVEETFDSSSIRLFLEKSDNFRKFTIFFQEDSSKYAILLISKNKATYAYFDDGNKWIVIQENKNYDIYDTNINLVIENYLTKNIVYKMDCAKEFIVFDGDAGKFQAVWIKENGKIKFIFYKSKGGIECLNVEDKNKILPLINVMKLFSL
jgi:hypothetical protein